MRISDWSSDVCSSDLGDIGAEQPGDMRAEQAVAPVAAAIERFDDEEIAEDAERTEPLEREAIPRRQAAGRCQVLPQPIESDCAGMLRLRNFRQQFAFVARQLGRPCLVETDFPAPCTPGPATSRAAPDLPAGLSVNITVA